MSPCQVFVHFFFQTLPEDASGGREKIVYIKRLVDSDFIEEYSAALYIRENRNCSLLFIKNR